MNRKFFISWLVVFIVWFFGSFLIHGLLLHPDYMQIPQMFRAEGDQQQFFPLMILSHAILSGAFVWIFTRGVEAKPWLSQGLRYGVAVALLTVVPNDLINFTVQPFPLDLVVKQIVLESILLLVLGALLAWLYRNPGASA